ncbi:DUF2087 domain-containing protein [Ruminiclostridium cellobioparum]|uniref:DUF2087 domain-containing protein n=1 Tax=Ruminiclostridium cellobioparum subsp. termitidis CT1112 TaxID=1195236 RepID=S0FK40_RUMCE|nr:DUF2087 domain-containing protein [Ruminiclostridium cellobioparum]EMS72182.1 hypothetical protein CTER_1892 [Ruminiclostridium cellobioparum subsp. termitidis CT1112]
MANDFINMTLEEIKNGYHFDTVKNCYICNICGKEFGIGEIFPSGNRFFNADRMINIHVGEEHPDLLELLTSYNKKYTGITDNQKEILEMMYQSMTDNEIAKKTGVAAATIRHQRFVFREKAKQAKLYLAIYELALRGLDKGRIRAESSDEIIDIHEGARMIDDRYMVTKAEEDKILEAMFTSLSPLKLKVISSKEKKKIVILKKISQQFERNKHYSEKEVNGILKQIHEDFATLRRYLIEYGFMERTNDCKEYWLK